MTTSADTADTAGATGVIARVAEICARAPKLVLVVAGVAFLVFGSLGGLVTDRLTSGGFVDPDAESAHAADVLAAEHGVSHMQLIFAVDAPGGADSPAARAAADRIVTDLRRDDRVSTVTSWLEPTGAALVSRDHRTGLVIAGLDGDDDTAQRTAHALAERHTGDRDGVAVLAGGQAMAFEEINAAASRDLVLAEAIAVPLTFLLLVLFLRSVIAAAVPVVVGVLAIVGTTAVLFALTFLTELSIFALNITTALGLALAIDYSLLLIGRYREEISRGLPHQQALSSAMRHGGRAVVFSGVIVGTALVGLWVFPMAFLRSIGYAGVAVVVLSILLALTCVPALLALLGPRMNRKPPREAAPAESTRLYRVARAVQRRPLLAALPVLALLLLAGSPVLDLRVGLPDDRVLAADAQSRQVGDRIRDGFDQNITGTVHIVVTGAPAERLGEYTAGLSRVHGVTAVSGPAGVYVAGSAAGPADGRTGSGGSAHLTVATALNPYSDEGRDQLDAIRAVDAPGNILVGGLAQQTADTSAGISRGFVVALLWIVATTALLLFLLTGSIVLPLKALVLNTLSLSATFGALVWIFQEGHLGCLGTTATGYTVATVPVLLFCVAFGLSMDYEVFLLSRFTEEWERSPRTRADADTAVAVGLARSGRVVTAAALLMAVVFVGIATSEVSIMRALGVGLALAVVLDAALVRTILVPAAMRIAGTANWWTPRLLAPVVARMRLRE
ncbi:efflux RND transporter permease subunit [Nocardia sp. CDC186]|uniref:Efflux RND transporter permease subunit n=1 Tax=Nocardia implantans TaxID=3108168 RepID=A0ABU6AZ74_9NOCA|nr:MULTISPECIES: efflux RND transporter permease subunit [unclassified Nocardia]MBF6194325.1 MMPL family transporter [Nocardia beijingensis]MEA3529934.1 efflux RND transporter permease subunit [Nocardia sp. CDC192]MEB3512588.1 efflux RND transporter permease subunit [Nocardia sp. CDC186]